MADDHKPYYAGDEQPEDLPPEEVLTLTPQPDSVDEIVKNIPQIAPKPDLKGQGVALWKIIVGISVLATIIAAYPVIQPLLPTPLAGEPAIIEGENREVLVLVAQFDDGEDRRLPDVGHNFANIAETAIEKLGNQVTARVLRIPQIITNHDQARAESDRYNATLVIWGKVFPRQLKASYTITPRWSQIGTEPGETSVAVSTIEELDTFVSAEGGDTDFILNFVLGQLLYFEQNDSEALPYFERAIAEAPVGREREMGLAGVYFYKGYIHLEIEENSEAAIDAYNKSLEIDPIGNLVDLAYSNRGLARLQQGDLEGAIADYDQALALNPELNIYNNRGKARADRGDLEGAIADYDQALALDPEDFIPYISRGITRHQLGDLAGAIKDYNRALEINPEFADAYWGLGTAYYDLEHFEESLTNYRRYLELAGDNPSSFVIDRVRELEAQLTATPPG